MRSLPSILKYFMKPKVDDYQMPDEEKLVSQLEEMIRLKESIPNEDAVDEKTSEKAKIVDSDRSVPSEQ